MYDLIEYQAKPEPWNKGKLVGQKAPLKPQHIWGIRIHLQMGKNARDLALFNLAIDSKLRGCDLVKLKVSDVSQNGVIHTRAQVLQQKTERPVKFEITEVTRDVISVWITEAQLKPWEYLFPSRVDRSNHLSTRQYGRIVKRWVTSIGLDPANYGTHTLRRTKVSIIYKRTKNLRAVQLLLGHSALESTVRYLGIEVDDALELSENTEI
ncbi:MAG: tyrosine-type recombinase/integrase [Parvibaculaceae bacterium]